MSLFLKLIFIFFIGSTIGWIFELFLRRFLHGKWVNPGFLVGPYLPIYGFGLVLMNIIDIYLDKIHLNPILIVIIMGLSMTLLELIGGLIFLNQGVRLWDYRDRKYNYKGVICPLFSFVWTLASAFYLFFIEERLLNALEWFSNNLSFSFILGVFTGVLTLDYIYSSKLYKRIKKYAKNNNIDIMYEKLKLHIKEIQDNAKEKYSFVLPFKQTKALKDYLMEYVEKYQNINNDKKER